MRVLHFPLFSPFSQRINTCGITGYDIFMAVGYDFHCPHCGYRARLSENGGESFRGFVEPMICRSCRALVMVVTHIDGPLGEFDDVGKCPECGEKNLEIWDQRSRECPKCGNRMNKDKKGKMLWG